VNRRDGISIVLITTALLCWPRLRFDADAALSSHFDMRK
jgi:hypothetical protein